jgi:hypothetical protein
MHHIVQASPLRLVNPTERGFSIKQGYKGLSGVFNGGETSSSEDEEKNEIM